MDADDERFLAGLRGPGHWTVDDARRVLGLWRESGDSRAGFARRHGLRGSRLAWWERRLGEWGGASAGAPAPWTELVVSSTDGAAVELGDASIGSRHAGAVVRLGDVEVHLDALDEASARFVVRLAELSRCS